MTKKPENLKMKNPEKVIRPVTNNLSNSTRLEKLKNLQSNKIKKEQDILQSKPRFDRTIEEWFEIKKLQKSYPIFRNIKKEELEKIQSSSRYKEVIAYIESLGGLDFLISKYIKKRKTQKDLELLKSGIELLIFHLVKSEGSGVLTPLNNDFYVIMKFLFPFLSRNKVKDAIRVLVEIKLITYIHGNKKRTYYDGVKKSIQGESLFSTPGHCSKIYLRDTQVYLGKVVGIKTRHKDNQTKKTYTLSREKIHLKIGGGEKGINYAKVRIKPKSKDLPKIEKPSTSRYQKRIQEKNDRCEKFGLSYNGQNIRFTKIFNNDEKTNGRDYSSFQNLTEKEKESMMYVNWDSHDMPASQINLAYMLITEFTYSNADGRCPYTDVILNLIPSLKDNLSFWRGLAKTTLLSIFHCSNQSGHYKVISKQLGSRGVCLNGKFRKFIQKYNISKEIIENGMNKSIDKNQFGKVTGFNKDGFKRFILANLFKLGFDIGVKNEKLRKDVDKLIEVAIKSFKTSKSFHKKNGLNFSNFSFKLFSAKDVSKSITEVHHVLQPYFYNKSFGGYLVFIENELMSLTEKELADKYDIPCLSIHDALYVHKSKIPLVKELLEKNMKLVCDRVRLNFLNKFVVRKAKINSLINYIFHIINNEWDTPFFIDIKALLLRMLDWLMILGGKGNYVAIH